MYVFELQFLDLVKLEVPCLNPLVSQFVIHAYLGPHVFEADWLEHFEETAEELDKNADERMEFDARYVFNSFAWVKCLLFSS